MFGNLPGLPLFEKETGVNNALSSMDLHTDGLFQFSIQL